MQTELIVSYSGRIKAAIETAEQYALATTQSATAAIQHACQAGELLAVARAELGAGYQDALDRAGIEKEKAARFISGAKKLRGLELPKANMRQLLLFFGDDEASAEPRPQPLLRDDGTDWVRHFARAAEKFQKNLDHRPVAEWQDHERELFRRMAEPIVRIWEQL